MNADNLDVRLLSFRSRRDESPLVLAHALLTAGRVPEALEVVQVGLIDAEDDCALLVLEGRAWFDQGDLPQAQAALLRAAKAHPGEKEPYRWLAQVMMKRGEPWRAIQVLDRALAIDPNDRPLRQARERAQRLARIASDADARLSLEPESPVSDRVEATDPLPSPTKAAPSALPVFASRPLVPAAVVPAAVVPAAVVPAAVVPAAVVPAAVVPAAVVPAAVVPAAAGKPAAAPALRPPARGLSAPPMAAPPGLPAPPMSPQREAPAVVAPLQKAPPSPDPVPQAVPAGELDEAGWEDEPTQAYELPMEIAALLASAPGSAAADNNSASEASASEANAPGSPVEGPAEPPARQRASLEVLPDPTGPFPLEGGATFDAEDDDEVFARDTAAPAGLESAPSEAVPGEPDAAYRFDSTEVNPDEPDAPEAVLEVLKDHGIFEAEPRGGEAWVQKREAPRAGNRLGKSLAVVWVLALLAAGGGYYGWTRFLESRRAEARTLIAKALTDAHDGDHERLVAAERRLIQARELDPKSDEAVTALLFVHAARALEDAAGDIGYLRATIARAERAKAPKGLLLAARSLLHTYDRNQEAARRVSEAALKAGADDARVLYLVGRLHQRMGVADAEGLLSQAAQKDPELSLAWLGQAEIAHQTGDADEAAQLFEQARGKDHTQLRAELWSIVLGGAEAARPIAKLEALRERVARGSVGDKLLLQLAFASIQIEQDALDAARVSVKEASQITVQDPELLSLLAECAATVGEHDLAYRAANAAMLAAPSNRRYHDALANVLLRRGDGRAVLAALAGLKDQGAWALSMRARAALLTSSHEAVEEAKNALEAHRESPEGKDDLDAAGLLIRLDLRLGVKPESLLSAARVLAQKNQDSPTALAALGEALLLAGKTTEAIKVLEGATELGEAADVYALLGRANRAAGQLEPARENLKRALAISPNHRQARELLGGVLLDSGDYAAAESLFAKLEGDRAGTSVTLGLVEALLGRGEVLAAKQRFFALSEEQRNLPGAQVIEARIAIAERRGREAVKLLEPMVDEDSELRTADILTLYGDALYASNMVDTAAGAYEAALELDATHPDALIGRAMAALRAEKLSQVYELLTAAEQSLTSRIRPPVVQATLQLTRGKARVLQQNFDQAIADLAKAVQVPSVAPDAYFWYAEALARTKNVGAAEQYTKYLEQDPAGEFAGRAKKALAPR